MTGRGTTAMLLVVTENGYGKRLPMSDVSRQKARGARGVKVSTTPIAAVLRLDSSDGDLVIATTNGKIERVAVACIPVRRRASQGRDRMSKGLRVVRLALGDSVAAVALTLAVGTVEKPPKGIPARKWPGGRVGLQNEQTRAGSERVSTAIPDAPLAPLFSSREREPGLTVSEVSDGR